MFSFCVVIVDCLSFFIRPLCCVLRFTDSDYPLVSSLSHRKYFLECSFSTHCVDRIRIDISEHAKWVQKGIFLLPFFLNFGFYHFCYHVESGMTFLSILSITHYTFMIIDITEIQIRYWYYKDTFVSYM